MSSLRLGSCFTTRKGHTLRVVQAVVRVAGNGAESPCVLVERTAAGRRAEVLLTVGILANQVRSSVHVPGKGPRIDWATVERRPQTRLGFAGICQPSLVRREDRGV